MNETIKRILELQPRYTQDNTPEMEERGTLVRHRLCDEIRALAGPVSEALGQYGGDFLVEASDGIGKKSELPWARSARRMSPGPR